VVVKKLKQVRAGLLHNLLTRASTNTANSATLSLTPSSFRTHRSDESQGSGEFLSIEELLHGYQPDPERPFGSSLPEAGT